MRFLSTLAGLLLATGAAAQDGQIACTISSCEAVDIDPSPFGSSDNFSVDQVWEVVHEILSVSGLAPNFLVVSTDEVGNAAAVVIKEERYLAFNPGWLNQYKGDPNAKWQLYGVMAHEVGHHLQGHTLGRGGSRPPTELEADEYAGFTLAALGATLQEAQSLFATLPERGSATHPGRAQRLEAVQRGWERQRGRPASQPAPAPAPAALARPKAAGEVCERANYGNAPATICVSSALAPQGNNAYDLRMAFDDNPATAWVEGVSGHGIGQYIAMEFDTPRNFSVLGVQNGYAKSDRTFTTNSRVSVARLQASNGADLRLGLDDARGWQTWDISALQNVTWLSFSIEDVFPGSKYTDTAIAEFNPQ